jgi:SAM-dependent methyltransferase
MRPFLPYRGRWLQRWLLCRWRNFQGPPSPLPGIVAAHQAQEAAWQQTLAAFRLTGKIQEWEQENQQKIAACLEVIQGTPSRCLELGCEKGWFGLQLRQRFPRLRYYGLDIRLEALRQGTGSGLVRGDSRLLPFRNGAADLVVARHLVEHLDDIRGFGGEVRRVLSPGGAVLITVPLGYQYDPCHRWYFMTAGGWKWFLEKHLRMNCTGKRTTGTIGEEFSGLFQA